MLNHKLGWQTLENATGPREHIPCEANSAGKRLSSAVPISGAAQHLQRGASHATPDMAPYSLWHLLLLYAADYPKRKTENEHPA